MSIYAGHPETTLLLGAGLVLFVAVVLVQRAPRLGVRAPSAGQRSIWSSAVWPAPR